ncbi:hypothetical protein IMZ48_38440 [Candidatus Bathyarchaeota archaeon]|nr:hypothetical protein [Candidatus Bathyarchaeota archaeon]
MTNGPHWGPHRGDSPQLLIGPGQACWGPQQQQPYGYAVTSPAAPGFILDPVIGRTQAIRPRVRAGMAGHATIASCRGAQHRAREAPAPARGRHLKARRLGTLVPGRRAASFTGDDGISLGLHSMGESVMVMYATLGPFRALEEAGRLPTRLGGIPRSPARRAFARLRRRHRVYGRHLPFPLPFLTGVR